jgi:hypothetical protein
MERRTVLSRSAALGAALVAGCTAGETPGQGTDRGSGGNGDGSDTPSDSPTPTPDPVTVADHSITTTRADCASGEDDGVSVTIDRDAGRVRVSGALSTPNPCHRATPSTVEYDAGSETLALDVVAVSTEDVCVECIGRVAYEATVDFGGGVPTSVVVTHEGEPVTRTEGGSGDGPAGGSGDGVGDDGSGGDSGDGDGGGSATAVTGSSLEVTGADSSFGPDDPPAVEVDFDDAPAVVVTGSVLARNGCETAMLDGVRYDGEADTHAVNVVAEVPPEKEDAMCTQTLQGVRYRASVEFAGGLPGTVEVAHEGEGVATGGHASASTDGVTSETASPGE